MAIYDPSSDTIWEMWTVKKAGDGSYTACWGGKLTNVSHSQGIFQSPYGVSATGLSQFIGLIRTSELQKGEINHAIGLALPHSQPWPAVSWPANRGDGQNPDNDPNAPRQGQRLRLDPSIDVDSLKISPVAKTIARAAQKYGFYISDTSGAVSMGVENPAPVIAAGKPDPYKTLYGGLGYWQVMDGFPWDKLQAIQPNYGKP